MAIRSPSQSPPTSPGRFWDGPNYSQSSGVGGNSFAFKPIPPSGSGVGVGTAAKDTESISGSSRFDQQILNEAVVDVEKGGAVGVGRGNVGATQGGISIHAPQWQQTVEPFKDRISPFESTAVGVGAAGTATGSPQIVPSTSNTGFLHQGLELPSGIHSSMNPLHQIP